MPHAIGPNTGGWTSPIVIMAQHRVRILNPGRARLSPSRGSTLDNHHTTIHTPRMTIQYSITTQRGGRLTTTVRERSFTSQAAFERWMTRPEIAGNVEILRYLQGE